MSKRIHDQQSQSIIGKQIDQIATTKEINLQQLVKELKDLTKERDQLKLLNIKLVERTEKLQGIIDD